MKRHDWRLPTGVSLAVLLALALPVVTARDAAAQNQATAFGDSITAGTGDSVPEGPNAGYPVRLQQRVPSFSIRNEGFPGEKTFEALDRIDSVLLDRGDVFLLMEGTNDLSQGFPIESIVFNLDELADRAEQVGFDVVHATVIPRVPAAKRDGGNVLNRQLNQGIRDLAGRRGRQLVDNFEIYSRLSNLFAKYYWNNPNDRVGHPNPAGYDVMADTFADVLSNVDSVPPVAGLLFPDLGDEDVSRSTSISVDLWDFGAGINTASAVLRINGAVTSAVPTGNQRGISFFYDPPSQLGGVVEVGVRASDLANPPHVIDRVVSRFAVVGASFLDGDFDASGTVDAVDLVQLSLSFGARKGETRYSPDADINADGIVDGIDLAILASNYG